MRLIKSRVVLDGTANAEIRTSGTAWGVGTDRLIVDKRTVVHVQILAPPKLSMAPPTLPLKGSDLSPVPPPMAWLPVNVQEVTVAMPSIQQATAKDIEPWRRRSPVLLVSRLSLRVSCGTGLIEDPATALRDNAGILAAAPGHVLRQDHLA